MGKETGLSSDLEDRFEKQRQTGHTGTLVLSEEEAYVGDTITLNGRNLSENEPLDVVWHTAVGHWGLLEGNEVVGPQFQHHSKRVDVVSTDETGAFTDQWEIPEDYGGEHRIQLRSADGETLAETTITIVPWFELDRTTAPLGQTFTVTGYGLGPNYITNNYQIVWDNSMVGFITGTKNRGTATAEIRAVGPVGEHVIQVWRNFHGVPFLQNNTQSPFGPVAGGRQSAWTVEVQEQESEFPNWWMDDLADEQPISAHLLEPEVESEAKLSITPNAGQPGTDAFVRGENFPPETTVDLLWYTHEGERIKGTGIAPEARPETLPTVTTDSAGRFQTEVTIPSDVGSTRPITATVDGQAVASTGFVLQPDIKQMTPTEGPVGTDIEFEIKAIGWTNPETAYFFVYDNRRVGYVCSTNNNDGVVRTVLKATGEPGTHFIDVYPGFMRMHEDEPDFTLKPHLSYRENHALRQLPAFHFTFEVTE